jgi:predicted phage terminase large subunit-like protein
VNKIAININVCKGEQCKRNFYKFVQEFWDINIAEVPVWNWHIKALCEELQPIVERIARRETKVEDVICNVPPGTTKSTIFTQMLPAWAWTIDPTLRILATSYSESLAKDHATYSRNIIRSDKYQKYFPNIKLSPDKDTKTDYTNTLNGQRVAAGIGGTITGKHFHLIIIDDPLNPKEANSEAECNNANAIVDNTLSTRKVDKKVTVTMVVMQRLSENDVTGHLLSKKGKKFNHIVLPAELVDGVKPTKYEQFYINGLLDINRLDKEVLAEQKIDLGSMNYAGQFSQKPAPSSGAIWQKWFIEIEDRLWPERRLFTSYGTDWDTAFTEKETNAASAYFSAGKINNNIYLDDFGFDWLEFPALVKWMKTKSAPHYIEDKASGISLRQTLSKIGVNAIPVPVRGGDKVARAKMATPPAEAGRVFIRKSLAERLYYDSKQGILTFPRGKYKDVADVLAQTIQRLDTKDNVIVSSNSNDDMIDDLDFD